MLKLALPGFDDWLLVPRAVRLGSDRLEWTFAPLHAGIKAIDGSAPEKGQPHPVHSGVRGTKEPSTHCLAAFIQLADATDERDFVAFVERFGVLGLHPVSDPGDFRGMFDRDGKGWLPGGPSPQIDENARRHDGWQWEPISLWREYAHEAKTILKAAIKLRKSELIGEDVLGTWSNYAGMRTLNVMGAAYPPRRRAFTREEKDVAQLIGMDLNALSKPRFPFTLTDAIAEQRGVLSMVVTRRWLDLASLSPRLRWYVNDEPRVSLTRMDQHETTLFTTLVFQLAAGVCSDDDFLLCELCGNPFPKGMRRKRFCPTCIHERKKEQELAWWNANRGKSVVSDSHPDSQEGS